MHDKINFELSESPFNLERKATKKLAKIIPIEEDYKSRITINQWFYAVQIAQSPINPQRSEILDIYSTILLDAVVSGKIENRLNASVLTDFNVIKNEEADPELKKFFNKKWFREFIEIAIESKLYGFSVVEFGDIINSEITEVDSINRYYIIPEKHEVKDQKWSEKGTSLDNFDVLFIGKKTDLGILHKVAQYALFKKELLSSYNQYAELFGMPMRVARVGGSYDSTTKQADIRKMLESMGSTSYGIFDEDTDIEFITANGSGNEIYQKIIDYCDTQISMLITGVKAETSSNYADANADSKVEDEMSMKDNLFVQDIINNILIPKLIEYGFTELIDARFEYIHKESINIGKQFEIDSKLIELGFEVDIDYIRNTYGTDIVSFEKPNQMPFTTEQKYKDNLKAEFGYEQIYDKYYKNDK